MFTGVRGGVLRLSNFARRFWRPAWDGDPDNPDPRARVPGFTFHEGRHTQRTWLADDHIPEVARAARLGHKLTGVADVYEHVTPEMRRALLTALQARWEASVQELTPQERRRLIDVVPAELAKEIAESDGLAGE
ncbi:hypothetical protein [Spirillospora sp. NPDC047279]|uniref:hypothetical protein n=1 Tax=Spirillospora sp. NPDC047279 TaxID=3155478 RepID=UPI0033EB6A65